MLAELFLLFKSPFQKKKKQEASPGFRVLVPILYFTYMQFKISDNIDPFLCGTGLLRSVGFP